MSSTHSSARGAVRHDVMRARNLAVVLGEIDRSGPLSRAALAERTAELDPDQPWPQAAEGPRGRANPRSRVPLPDGWLADPYDAALPDADAESDTSGG